MNMKLTDKTERKIAFNEFTVTHVIYSRCRSGNDWPFLSGVGKFLSLYSFVK